MGLISPFALVGCSYLDLFIKLPKPHHGALTGCVGVLARSRFGTTRLPVLCIVPL